MGGGLPGAGLCLGAEALGRLMPLFLALDAAGRVIATGPTLARILSPAPVVGRPLADLFEARPRGRSLGELLPAAAGRKIQLALALPPHTGFRGVVVPMAGGGRLLNLGLGVEIAAAVRDHALTQSDFAPTDHALDVLYLAEANRVIHDAVQDTHLRLERAKALAEAQALTDTLTGLPNRRAMDAAIDRALLAGVPIAVVRIDLDWFKAVNDTLGHAAGDAVLRATAAILRQEMRAGDLAARVGGDEFVLVLPGVVAGADVEGIVRRILGRLAQPIPWEGRTARVSASFGYVLSAERPGADAERLLEDADAALYAAKRAGRGRLAAHGGRGGAPPAGPAGPSG